MEEFYNKAKECMDNNEIDEAITYYEEAAYNNHIASIKALIEIYSKGINYNHTRLIYWKDKLAELGDYDAILYLAKYYYDSHKEHNNAIKYLNMAIAKGYVDGYYYLYKIYIDGNNENYDLELAEEYFQIALESESHEAMRAYGYDKIAYTNLSKEQLQAKGFSDTNDGYLTLEVVDGIELIVDTNYRIGIRGNDLELFGYAQTKFAAARAFTELEIDLSSDIISNKKTDIIPLPKESFLRLKNNGYYFLGLCYDPVISDSLIIMSDSKIVNECINPEGFHMYVGNMGYANIHGDAVIPPQYKMATSFFENKAIVVDANDKYAMIDNMGNHLLEHEYDLIEYERHYKPFSDFDEYVYLAYKDGYCYVYNEKIELIYSMKSDSIQQDYYMECIDNVIKVKMFASSKTTIINTLTKEEYSYELDFDDFSILTTKYLYIISDGKYYITDYNLNPVLDIEFNLPLDTFFKHTDGKRYLHVIRMMKEYI